VTRFLSSRQDWREEICSAQGKSHKPFYIINTMHLAISAIARR
jgi:hypothetical protein